MKVMKTLRVGEDGTLLGNMLRYNNNSLYFTKVYPKILIEPSLNQEDHIRGNRRAVGKCLRNLQNQRIF